MKNNKEMAGLLNRDKKYNKFAMAVMLIPIVYYTVLFITAIISYFTRKPSDYLIMDEMFSLYFDAMLPLCAVFVIGLQILRWGLFEGNRMRHADMALPVSSKTRVLYDWNFGFKMIIGVNGIYFVEMIIHEICEIFANCRSLEKFYGMETLAVTKAQLLKDVFQFAFECHWYAYVDMFKDVLIVLVIYSMLVLGKYVASSINWAGVFAFCSSLALYIISEFAYAAWFNSIGTIGSVGTVRWILANGIKILLIVGAVRISCKAAKEKDEARYGAYYFKIPRWIVCFMITLLAIIGGLVSITVDVVVVKVILSILVVAVLGGGVLAGMIYVTAAKRG